MVWEHKEESKGNEEDPPNLKRQNKSEMDSGYIVDSLINSLVDCLPLNIPEYL